MPDTAFMISPAGFIVDVNFGGPSRPGVGSLGPPIVTPLLPGGVVQARGNGQQFVTGLNGTQGTLEAFFVTGTPGSPSIVALLTDGKRGAIGIGVDDSNRPFGLVQDLFGNIVASIPLPLSPAPAGVPYTVRLVWNAVLPAIVVEVQQVSSSAELTQVWTPFVPSSLWLGSAGGFSFAAFDGTVNKVQVSSFAEIHATVVSVRDESARVAMLGSASVAASATVGHEVPKFVQVVQSSPATAGSFPIAITPTAGNLLILAVGMYQHGVISSVTDDNGNTWQTAVASMEAGNAAGGVFYAAACHGGLTNVTVTLVEGEVDVDLIIHEYSGCAASNPIDATATGFGATGTSLATGPLVTTKANDMIFSFSAFIDQNIASIGAGYTLRSNLSTDEWTASGDMLAATPGTYTGTWNSAVNTNWLIMAVALLAGP